MTKTDTRDVKATLRQIHELKEAGCEIVRPAVPDAEAALALKEIASDTTVEAVRAATGAELIVESTPAKF